MNLNATPQGIKHQNNAFLAFDVVSYYVQKLRKCKLRVKCESVACNNTKTRERNNKHLAKTKVRVDQHIRIKCNRDN